MILSKSDRSRIEVGSSRLLGIVGQPTYLPIPVIRQRYCQEIVNQLREPRKIIAIPKGYREELLCSMIQYHRLRILL
jgi:hypothetical protein